MNEYSVIKQIQQPAIPVNQLPFEFLFSGKTALLNKTFCQKLSPSLAAALHEIVWRADRNSGKAILSAEELGMDLSISTRSARKLLSDLKKIGIIESRRGAPKNIFTINPVVSREILGAGTDENSGRSMPAFYYTDRRLSIPKSLLRELGVNEAAVYLELVWFYRRLLMGRKIRPGKSFYTTNYAVGREIGLSEDQVYRAISKLRKKGLVSTDRRGYARKCHFLLDEEAAKAFTCAPDSRHKLSKNAADIDTFRGTITILNNTTLNKNSEIGVLDNHQEDITNKSLPFHGSFSTPSFTSSQENTISRFFSSRDSDWEIYRKPEVHYPQNGDGEIVYIATIPGITLEGDRKYTVRQKEILETVGRIYRQEVGEEFRFGAGKFDREDLNAIGKFSLGEIERIAYTCVSAWRRKLPGFRNHKPHIRTISARLDLLAYGSLEDLEVRMQRNRKMRLARESGKLVGAKSAKHGQYCKAKMADDDWG